MRCTAVFWCMCLNSFRACISPGPGPEDLFAQEHDNPHNACSQKCASNSFDVLTPVLVILPRSESLKLSETTLLLPEGCSSIPCPVIALAVDCTLRLAGGEPDSKKLIWCGIAVWLAVCVSLVIFRCPASDFWHLVLQNIHTFRSSHAREHHHKQTIRMQN